MRLNEADRAEGLSRSTIPYVEAASANGSFSATHFVALAPPASGIARSGRARLHGRSRDGDDARAVKLPKGLAQQGAPRSVVWGPGLARGDAWVAPERPSYRLRSENRSRWRC